MVTYPSISVDLVRNYDDHTKDDKIIISYRDIHTISVKYRDVGHAPCHVIRQELFITNTPLGTYINDMVTLLIHDEQPFKTVQFNFPGYPSVLFTPKTLLENWELRESLRSIANTVSDSWYKDAPYDSSSGIQNSENVESHY